MTLSSTVEPMPERQPYISTIRRVIDELASSGSPLGDDQLLVVREVIETSDADLAVAEKALATRVLLHATIDRHGYATLRRGDASPLLVEKGWTTFLVRIENPSALIAPLHLASNPVGGFQQRPAPGEFTEGKSHQVTLPVSIAQVNDKAGYTIVQTQDAVEPAFEQQKCNLIDNPSQNEVFVPNAEDIAQIAK